MSYDKLRHLEKLLSSIYSEGLEKHRDKIEEYFEKNYGKDSLVKPILTTKVEESQEKLTTNRKLNIPDNLDEIMSKAVKRVFGR